MLTRRRLEVLLGLLWLLDGALQLQPFMFTREFFSDVLGMANMGLPGPLSQAEDSVAGLLMAHPAVWNAVFAGLQVGLGVAFLVGGRATRLARPVSVAWALSVWVLGEGVGGVFMGGASVLNGAPGAAILYAVATLALWPRRSHPEGAPGAAVAAAGVLGRWAMGVWSALWLTVAVLEAAGPNHLPYVPGAEITDGANGEPAPLAVLNRAAGRVVGFHGAGFALALGVAAAALALLPWSRRLRRPALGAGMVLVSVLGLVGGDLGGIFTGQGTDPGVAPLAVLLGLILWPRGTRRGELADGSEPAGAGPAGAAAVPARVPGRAAREPVPVPAR